ncbi:MAG TPA: ATP-binding cassette domain-containing protein [Candidatus Limicola stercorigallinarum]|nr:ATP-binding cassette domain-containing protein [Candidatus Limicola stercorigallinarum]
MTARPTPSQLDRPVIHLSDVHYAYPASSEETASSEALAGISLDIYAGEHVCILGGNGSGKSTLVQLMNGLLTASSGTVEVFGIDAGTWEGASQIRRRASMVFQHPDDQMVTSIVADDVAFGPENLGVPQPEMVRRVDEALEAVGMRPWAQADPSDLSGGQRQRVAIAGALAMHPEVLLLDEPSAMLDVSGRQAIQAIIDRLVARGITIVHVTHFMDDALRAQRVIVLDHGRIALEGTPLEVFRHRDTVARLGLELPFTVQLADALDDTLPGLPLTADIDEAARELAAKLARKDGKADSEVQKGTIPSANNEAKSDRTADVRISTDAHGQKRAGNMVTAQRNAAIAFERVSFSYAADATPRKRRFFKRGKRMRSVPFAVQNLSFSCPHGTLTALVGCTGSGKSTTVELACALKMPTSGRVLVDGIDTTDINRRLELRSRVGYVSQLPEHQLFAETVYDDVAFGPRNLELDEAEVKRRVLAALREAGLEPTSDLLTRSPFALSGGQQRSVAIAGILAMNTPVLVLDEPMAGLDPQGRTRMRALIAQLKQNGTTLLLVTHAMEDVAELADQVVVLDKGALADAGTPAEVFDRTPCHAPGAPAALDFARRLTAHGAPLQHDPLTLADLVEEVRDDATR